MEDRKELTDFLYGNKIYEKRTLEENGWEYTGTNYGDTEIWKKENIRFLMERGELGYTATIGFYQDERGGVHVDCNCLKLMDW